MFLVNDRKEIRHFGMTHQFQTLQIYINSVYISLNLFISDRGEDGFHYGSEIMNTQNLITQGGL